MLASLESSGERRSSEAFRRCAPSRAASTKAVHVPWRRPDFIAPALLEIGPFVIVGYRYVLVLRNILKSVLLTVLFYRTAD